MGRKAKPKMTQEELEDEVILKYMNGEPMTLDEARLALWMHEGRKTPKPMSKMGFLKLEQRALAHALEACLAHGITKEDIQLFVRHEDVIEV